MIKEITVLGKSPDEFLYVEALEHSILMDYGFTEIDSTETHRFCSDGSGLGRSEASIGEI